MARPQAPGAGLARRCEGAQVSEFGFCVHGVSMRRTCSECRPQQIPAVFPPPQRKTPVTQQDFRHAHDWAGTLDGKRICKGCGLVSE